MTVLAALPLLEAATSDLSAEDRRAALLLALKASTCRTCQTRVYPVTSRSRAPIYCRACLKLRVRVQSRPSWDRANARRKAERAKVQGAKLERQLVALQRHQVEPLRAVVRRVPRPAPVYVPPVERVGEDTPLILWGRVSSSRSRKSARSVSTGSTARI